MSTVAIPGRRTRGALTVQTISDRAVLRQFLETDRLFAAYALCDLEDREFGRTRWGAATDGDQLVAIVLEYSGMTPQPMFAMGRPDGIEAILSDVIRPRAAYVAALPESLPAIATQYRVDPGAADGPDVGRPGATSGRIRRTSGACCPVEIGELNRLYQLGFASWLPSSAIAEGVYYGIRVGGRLVAAAGTHVVSRRPGWPSSATS